MLDESVRGRIVTAHAVGQGWTAIARELNETQVPTARGGAIWHPSTVQAVVRGSAATSLHRDRCGDCGGLVAVVK